MNLAPRMPAAKLSHLLLAGLLLTACRTELHVKPTAVAVVGPDHLALVGDAPVVLDGLDSFVAGLPPGTPPDTARWTIVVAPPSTDNEPAATIEDQDTLRAAMHIHAPGLFVVRLDVSHDGVAGKPAYVNVRATRDPTPPVAVAGSDQEVDPGEEVLLDGSESHSPDGAALAFSWTQVHGPRVTLAGADTASPSFTAPRRAGRLTFELTVTDERDLESRPDTVRVTVRELAPVADAGPSRTCGELDIVTLDGTASHHPNEEEISFAWHQDTGDGTFEIVLEGADTATPSFQAPRVSEALELTLVLVVEDGRGLTGSDSTTVTVEHTIVALAVHEEPPAALEPGEPFSIAVEILDDNGDREVRADDEITISLTGGPQGATLQGDLSRVSTGGLAEFHDLSIQELGEGYRIVAEAQRLQPATTSAFEVALPPIAQVVVVDHPETTPAGEVFSVHVEARDEHGDIATDFDGPITLSIHEGPSDGVLLGATTVDAANGEARFDDIRLNRAGDYILEARATHSITDLTGVITVMPGPPVQLVIVSGAHEVGAGQCASPLTIEMRDQLDNPSATDAGTRVRLDSDPAGLTFWAGEGCSGAPLDESGPELELPAGSTRASASFMTERAGQPLVEVEAAGLTPDSQSQTIRPLPPSMIVFDTDPHDVAAGECSGVVALVSRDELDNISPVSAAVEIDLASSPEGDMAFFTGADCDQATEVATVTLTANESEVTFRFQDTRAGAPTISAAPDGFDTVHQQQTVRAGAPAMVSLVASPEEPVAGTSTTLTATFTDAHDNPVPDSQVTFSVTAGSGELDEPPEATTNTDGQANIEYTTAATIEPATLRAAWTGDASVHDTVEVISVAGDPFQVVLVADPQSPVAGTTTTVTATVTDANENLVPNATVTFSIDSGTGTDLGTIEPPETVDTNANGEASCLYTTAATVQTVTLRAAWADDAGVYDTLAVTSVPGNPSRLSFTVQPTDTAAGEHIEPAVEVEIRDANGNRVTTATDEVSLFLEGGDEDATLSGTNPASAVDGVATFGDLSIDLLGTDYRLRAESGSLEAATSGYFDVRDVGPLQAHAGPSQTGKFPWDTVYLSGSASGGSPPYTFTWVVTDPLAIDFYTFGADTDDWPGELAIEDEQSPLFWPRRAGTYTILLGVTDAEDTTATDSMTVTVVGFEAIGVGGGPHRPNLRRLAVIPSNGYLGAATRAGGEVWVPDGLGFDLTEIDCAASDRASSMTVGGAPGNERFVLGFSNHDHITRVDGVSPLSCTNIHVGGPLPDDEPEVYGLARRPDNGDVWIATNADVTVLPAGEDEVDGHYYFGDPDETYRALAFAHPQNGVHEVFISDDGGEYYRTDADSFDHEAPLQQLAENSELIVYMLRGALAPNVNEMWFATDGDGLFRLVDVGDASSALVELTESDGLPSNDVGQLAFEDASGGDIWIVTGGGLARYKRDVDAIVELPSGQDGLCDTPQAVAVDDFDPQDRGRRVFVGCNGALRWLLSRP